MRDSILRECERETLTHIHCSMLANFQFTIFLCYSTPFRSIVLFDFHSCAIHSFSSFLSPSLSRSTQNSLFWLTLFLYFFLCICLIFFVWFTLFLISLHVWLCVSFSLDVRSFSASIPRFFFALLIFMVLAVFFSLYLIFQLQIISYSKSFE